MIFAFRRPAFQGGALLCLALASCRVEDIELVPARSATAGVGDAAADSPADAVTTAEPSAVGCERVDFLFVVDNSGSMREEQENLARSFPGFIDVVQRSLRARDYHIMVVDTDASSGAAGLRGLSGIAGDFTCRPAPACCQLGCVLDSIPGVNLFQSCNGNDCGELLEAPRDPCEGALGAGKRLSPDGISCGIVEPDRYMVEGQPGLSDAFSCVAQVGTFGAGDEQPMAALLAALSSRANGQGGCNAGFLRDDAVAVITIISDEDDERSPGDVAAWTRALLDAKAGNGDAIVLLGLVGDGNVPGGLPGGPCADQAQPAPALQEFVSGFRFGTLGSVCAPDYTPFFRNAVATINGACNEFRPVLR